MPVRVSCPIDQCGQLITHRGMTRHVNSKHRGKPNETRKNVSVITKDSVKKPRLIKDDIKELRNKIFDLAREISDLRKEVEFNRRDIDAIES